MEAWQIKAIPKVELHCHLDGSIQRQTLREIYQEQGLPLKFSDEELNQLMIASKSCNLTEYINCFRIVAAGLHTKKALQIALLDVVQQAVSENIIYLEIRLSPLHLANADFSLEEVAEALIEACHLAEKQYPIKVRLIFCCMRRQLEKDNKKVIDLVKKYFGTVVAIDLAGDESKYPTCEYQDLFSYASRLGIPYTIHAGETGDLQSALAAIDYGAQRIGHGIALMQSTEALATVAKENILLEMCPVCNIQTGAAKSWESYPAALFLEQGVAFSFNTDNRTVSNTTLTNEFLQMNKHCFKLSAAAILQQTKNTIKYIFAEEKVKQELMAQIEKY
ncbi:adenosine deaminase [Enterococcus sp. PF1-24]|uniref:adenosine deaminase n=1 Tax=unclassified Enterococcus TaxID=2608891 RepID=UPI002474795C|nr:MULTISPECIES: adenosine deaminase [unclassified Enterococcus]MDH6365783.1 adenosine deaminase [Enterococcus sp. PFB1-1]MDH6402884.1 adenosine deaminase [Enterococcus sp. PF1-24]